MLKVTLNYYSCGHKIIAYINSVMNTLDSAGLLKDCGGYDGMVCPNCGKGEYNSQISQNTNIESFGEAVVKYTESIWEPMFRFDTLENKKRAQNIIKQITSESMYQLFSYSGYSNNECERFLKKYLK